MWSVGCIIAELYNKDIFVQAGTSNDYLKSLLKILGPPNEKIKNSIKKNNFLKYLIEHET